MAPTLSKSTKKQKKIIIDLISTIQHNYRSLKIRNMPSDVVTKNYHHILILKQYTVCTKSVDPFYAGLINIKINLDYMQ